MADVARFFVFEDDVAAVVGVLHDLGQPLEVGRRAPHFGFDLRIDRIGCDPSELSIRLVAAEIAAVEIDAEPGAIDIVYEF